MLTLVSFQTTTSSVVGGARLASVCGKGKTRQLGRTGHAQ
jgi:hypothetical protein